MAIGERIRYFRTKYGMTQRELGRMLGYPESNADVRVAQYESGSRTPRAGLQTIIANIFDVVPDALSVPDIDDFIGLMHTLFAIEDNYGLYVDKVNGEVCLKVKIFNDADSEEFYRRLCQWQQSSDMLRNGYISKDQYDDWRYQYPLGDKLRGEEFDRPFEPCNNSCCKDCRQCTKHS